MDAVAVSYDTTTLAQYVTLQQAYDLLNDKLWSGKLPQVLITLQRKKGAQGYFSPERFVGRGSKDKAHELALNPDTFVGRTDREILSILAHEMAHVWQQEFGKPSRNGYHNKQWGTEMKRIGLYPSDTGEKDGKETGQNMTHYILDGGLYSVSYDTMKEAGIKLSWESPAGAKVVKAKKPESKVKYTCSRCEANAWGKPDSALICGVCFEDGATEHMIPA